MKPSERIRQIQKEFTCTSLPAAIILYLDEQYEKAPTVSEEKREKDDRLQWSLDRTSLKPLTISLLRTCKVWNRHDGCPGRYIETVGDLVQTEEQMLLKTKGIGRQTVREIKELLRKMGLHLAD